jgi:C-terminal processing protease CtpA/Prc
MKYKVLAPLLFSLSLLLSSCGSDRSSSSLVKRESSSEQENPVKENTSGDVSLVDSKGFSLSEKEFVHDLFLTEYLWYEQVASNIDYNNFSTPQSLIDGLKVLPPDQWSFSITAQQYEDSANQKTTGFGFGYTSDFNIFLVRIGSPAYGKLLRGDKILEVNGEAASDSNIANASQNINVSTTFTVLRGSSHVDVVVVPRAYTFKVTLGNVIDNNGIKVGYLRYDSFTGTSVNEFEQEFTKFKTGNISELVIDLRYNGGGSVDVASSLLDNLTNVHAGERQVYLDWNANYQNKNSTYYFSDDVEANDLNMRRVIFLVTRNSASASEMVISALKPYLGDAKVVTIGDATHGKPVGMNGRSYGSNYYFLVNFFVRNDHGERTSFSGIPATCAAEDDITHIMGDPEETMLKTALHYIDTDRCL